MPMRSALHYQNHLPADAEARALAGGYSPFSPDHAEPPAETTREPLYLSDADAARGIAIGGSTMPAATHDTDGWPGLAASVSEAVSPMH